ncbi:class I SAM-dependent DNA methyltransferase [Bradyrhizobium sp.]|uniref:class I SAM-dependent DNA methyltransferase n=1 Tax=Bradyrhizobium sp. TaxID=376 RepID=UPI003C554493
MRTAADFNQFYEVADPWKIGQASFRDRVYRRLLRGMVHGRTVLELGCGEGHLTEVVFDEARTVTGIDISNVAIERAKARNLSNARFENSDFLRTSFEGYDLIVALECIYYLSPDEQEEFFAKIVREHTGRLILSAPIIGENKFRRYFTHDQLIATFARHGMTVAKFHNLNISRRDLPTTAAAIAVRIAPALLDWMPEPLIYQRLYMIRIM